MAALRSLPCPVPFLAGVLFAGVSAIGPSTTRLAAAQEPGDVATTELARRLVSESGVAGGLAVLLGGGNGRLAAALRGDDAFLVQSLEADADDVAATREPIRQSGLYGPVSAVPWPDTSRLPYADNLVNLLVIRRADRLPREEILRALAPRGAAMFLADDGAPRIAERLVKPWPAEIDEWTHHLHDAGGNAVARDRAVAPPQRLQWTCGPLWSRSHGWTPSVSAMVSARGRIFYLGDETLTCVDGSVPDRWFLTARDAFSGVRLWKLPVPDWGSEPLSGTPGTGAGSTTGRFTMPPSAGKRLVAVEDTVYVTLGADAAVTALDAATGRERCVYAETAGADELVWADGRLIATLHPAERPAAATPPAAPPPAPGKRVCAIDTATGRLLWNKGPFTAIRATRTQDPFGRLELLAGEGKVFLLTHDAIESLAADSGERIWRIPRPALPDDADRRLGFAGVYEFLLSVLVYHDGVVLLAQPEPNSPHTYHTMPGSLYAFDARDGQLLWKHAYGAWGHCTQPDVFAVGSLVWTHMHVPARFHVAKNGWIKVPDTASVDYRAQALDLRTGELRKELSTRDLFNVGHHHRCYRNKITERYLTASRRGVEFVDLETGENTQNHWVRSGCLLGNLPCNGMIYVAPHSCGCYLEAKLTGFNALAPGPRKGNAGAADATANRATADEAVVEASRLERGPAWGQPRAAAEQASADDWPAYRHDNQRSGATETEVALPLSIRWQQPVGRRPSAPVVAGGRVFVAEVDGHTVHARDADTGAAVWQRTAGARVDSPPAIAEGLAIFGSTDGYVQALKAADGTLAWRFRAAPRDAWVTVSDQLESPWPVPGSVLIREDECWFAAGRSSYLDGGIHVFSLRPSTGELLSQETVFSPAAATGKMSPETDAHQMEGLLNDIPAASGATVFLRQQPISPGPADGAERIFSTAGFLDPSWFNRTYWKLGNLQTSGLMVLGRDGASAFGMEVFASRSRETVFRPASGAYRLLRLARREAAWEQRVPIRVSAMVRAGATIFVAGSPDIVDPADPHGAWEGRMGGVLAAHSAADGSLMARIELPSPPVWDGMAAAGGRLYLSLLDGSVICLAAKP